MTDIERLQKRAHRAVYMAVERGELVRQPCEDCGSTLTQAHHEDYNQPLTVEWLCRSCHRKRHPNRRWREREMPKAMSKRLLTPRQVAELAGVSPRTVVRWIRDGKLPAVKLGRVWRIEQSEVRKMMHDGL